LWRFACAIGLVQYSIRYNLPYVKAATDNIIFDNV
jgi:hypothetical protein